MYAHTHFHYCFFSTVVYNLDHTQANTVVLKNNVPPPLSHSPQTYFYSLANIIISKSTLTLTKISQGISGYQTCSDLQRVKAYITCYFCPWTCAIQPALINEYGSSWFWMSGNRSYLNRWEAILKVSYFHNPKAKQPHRNRNVCSAWLKTQPINVCHFFQTQQLLMLYRNATQRGRAKGMRSEGKREKGKGGDDKPT